MTYPVPTKRVPAVVFDFDGTLAEDTWPSPHIGEAIRDGLLALRHYASQGFAIYIHTARPASHQGMIEHWLVRQHIANLVYDVRYDKPIADLYIDDRAWRPPWAPPAEAEAAEDVAEMADIPDEEWEVIDAD